MKMVYLARHGETTWNSEGKLQGMQDAPLSERGRTQTSETVRYLSVIPFQLILTSPLQRTRAIADPVATRLGLSPTVLADLQEIDFGKWEAHTRSEIKSAYPDSVRAWGLRSMTARPEGGESLAEVVTRARRVRSLLESTPATPVLVVSHGAFSSVLIPVLLDLAPSGGEELNLPNGSVSIFTLDITGWRTNAIACTDHLTR
jgi:probable phosphoglycerate mutase